MNTSDIAKAWIAAGKILAADPSAKGMCPVCSEAHLDVQDIQIEGSNKFERIMRCPNCDAYNALLMTGRE